MRWFHVVVVTSVLFWGVSIGTAAERFQLEVPNEPALNSTAIIDGDTLTIVDADGNRFVYEHVADYDTADFAGFYSEGADRFIRWPVKGRGALQIGTQVGNRVSWSPSRMRIRAVEPPTPPAPGLGDDGPPGPAGARRRVPIAPDGWHVAATQLGEGVLAAARIDRSGFLHFHVGIADRWEHVGAELPADLLVPGGAMVLVPDPQSTIPAVYTVTSHGELIEILEGHRTGAIPGLEDIRFVPGSRLQLATDGQNYSLFAVDDQGRLWEIDPINGRHRGIEERPGLLPPGATLCGDSPLAERLFLIDRGGNLIAYRRDPRRGWRGPDVVSGGFVAGGGVTAWLTTSRGRPTVLQVAAVDRRGQMQILLNDGADWTAAPANRMRLAPGSPVATFFHTDRTSLLTTMPNGQWVESIVGVPNARLGVLAEGFASRTPIAVISEAGCAFAVDQTGRIICAEWANDHWQPFLLLPEEQETAPQVVRRRSVIGRGLQPANVTLLNTHAEQLIVRVFDARLPDRPQEFILEPGEKAVLRADRDEGGTLEETYLAIGPLGLPVEEVQTIQLPPATLYDIVVYENRVDYTYIDRTKKKGPLPDFQEASSVSLGAFPLPPGQAVRDGAVIDVYREATRFRNPGAAALLDAVPPQP